MSVVEELDPDVEDGVYYPSSDGKPMGETGYHVVAILELVPLLKDLLKGRTDWYVGADMFWYWEKGNPKACCSPDVMVILGVGNHERRSFRSWNEGGAVPAVIFEMASRKTWKQDLGTRRNQYERLGVKDYFVFDPEAKFVRPPLVGFSLRRKKYVPIRPGKDGSLWSQVLGVRVLRVGRKLRLVDPQTGALIRNAEERAEDEQKRADDEQKRADDEQKRADEARRQVEEERQRADHWKAEADRLRALLESKKGLNGKGVNGSSKPDK